MNMQKDKIPTMLQLRLMLRSLFSLNADKAPEEETIASIKAGIDFRGANLWILIFAIFVASLGLNTNSAAVIIGAMLISPLMGPIIGMGLGVGINDFELLKRAFRSFATASIFSVLTATFYFYITPIAEAQSELLARTSPTIYDVLIALFGGLAGIVALSSTGQRGGNVIPGVAIATALMPPLCTTGFGIATGNWLYAAGAFYLYIINSIFISLATFVGVNIMHFRKKVFVDKQREKRVKHIIITIAVLTILPATLLTFVLVRENIFETKVNSFIAHQIANDSTQVISKNVDYRRQEVRLVTIGSEISAAEQERIQQQLEHYDLQGVRLCIVQGTKNMSAGELQHIIGDHTAKVASESSRLVGVERSRADRLEAECRPYRETLGKTTALAAEIKPLFADVTGVSVGRGTTMLCTDSAQLDTTTLVVINMRRAPSKADRQRLEQWLSARLRTNRMQLIIQ